MTTWLLIGLGIALLFGITFLTLGITKTQQAVEELRQDWYHHP